METDRLTAIVQTLEQNEQAERAAAQAFARFVPMLFAQIENLLVLLREKGAHVGTAQRRPIDPGRETLTFDWTGGLACSLEPSAEIALPHPEDYQAPPHAGEHVESPAGRVVVFLHPQGLTEPAMVLAAFHVFAAGWSGPGVQPPALGAFDEAATREAAATLLEALSGIGRHFSALKDEQLDAPIDAKPPLGFRLRKSEAAPLLS